MRLFRALFRTLSRNWPPSPRITGAGMIVSITFCFLWGCARLPRNSDSLVIIIPKLVGIPYFNSARDGAAAALRELGLRFDWTGPTVADAGLQVDILASTLARNPGVIAVSCNDPYSVVPILRRAHRYHIPVITWDSDSQPEVREWFVSQVEDETLGRHVMDVLAAQMEKKGKFAIITGALTAANLNSWMSWMKIQQREYYPEMQLVSVLAGNDDQQIAFVEAQQLLQAYPDLRGFIGNSSAAPPAIARAVEQAGLSGQIAITGLSTPNLMRQYLTRGTVKTITLWDPKKLGMLTAEIASMVLHHQTPYDGMQILHVGSVRVFADRRVIVMGPPLDFTAQNVDQFNF
jgi:rhamnose transport system substrate-binding protein